jgi:RNA polymerase sigma factor (sigma-70 family)
VVRGILGNPSESEDVAQEVFLKAYANLAKFRGESGFFTWLYRIAVNEALRARKRRTFANADALPEVEAPPPAPTEDAPLRHAEKLLRKLSTNSVDRAPRHRGLAYPDVAETLEIPIGTVGRDSSAPARTAHALRKSKEAKNVPATPPALYAGRTRPISSSISRLRRCRQLDDLAR